MTSITVTLDKKQDKIIGIIKSMYGLSSKDKAIKAVIDEVGEEIIERELRPEFVRKIQRIEKEGKYREFRSIKELRGIIERS